MSDQRREITPSFTMFALLTIIALAQCSIADDTERMARLAETNLCIEAARVGVEPIPDPCQKRIKDQQ
ncbi:MAG: hypothetical protein C0494_12655 [Sphingobium sp.]|nr:hypothetical protein [Sphingobium sp.]